MLILTRRIGETIRINDDISVTVLAITGGQVRLGIEAPESVHVHRQEIYDRIHVEKMKTASVDAEQVNQVACGGENVNQGGKENFPGPTFNIDDHVQMAADARRYRWLKACEFEQANNLIVDVSEDDWDAKIDNAISLQALEAEPCEQ